jgi:hypothetical protein
MRPTLLYIRSQAVVPAKGESSSEILDSPIEYGAGSIKPGMTIKAKGLLTHDTTEPKG